MSVKTGVSLERAPVLAVVVAVAIVAAMAGGGPFALLFAAIWCLAVLCLRHTRKAKQDATTGRPDATTGFRYHLCASGVRHLVPMGIAVAFYVLLSIYISLFRDSVSIDWLIGMQRTFEDVSRFFTDNLKLTAMEVLGALVGIYALSCLLLSRRMSSRAEDRVAASDGAPVRVVANLHRALDLYGRYTGPIAVALATLASVTLFGMQLGRPAEDLRLRVKVAQAGYAEIARRTEAELSQRVSTALYDKIRDAFAPSYRASLRLPTRVDDSLEWVRDYAYDVRVRYSVRVTPVDRLLRSQRARSARVKALESNMRIEASGGRRPPGSSTYDELTAARNALGPERQLEGLQLIRVGQKKVVLHVEKLAGSRIAALTKPVTDAIPILGPLLATFAEAVDTSLQERIGRSYDRAMRAALRDPRAREATIDREVKSALAETRVGPLIARATARARRESRKLRHTLAALTASEALIDARVVKDEVAWRSSLRSFGIRDPAPPYDLRPLRPVTVPELYDSPRFSGDVAPRFGGGGGVERLPTPVPRVVPVPEAPVRPPRLPLFFP